MLYVIEMLNDLVCLYYFTAIHLTTIRANCRGILNSIRLYHLSKRGNELPVKTRKCILNCCIANFFRIAL